MPWMHEGKQWASNTNALPRKLCSDASLCFLPVKTAVSPAHLNRSRLSKSRRAQKESRLTKVPLQFGSTLKTQVLCSWIPIWHQGRKSLKRELQTPSWPTVESLKYSTNLKASPSFLASMIVSNAHSKTINSSSAIWISGAIYSAKRRKIWQLRTRLLTCESQISSLKQWAVMIFYGALERNRSNFCPLLSMTRTVMFMILQRNREHQVIQIVSCSL